MKFLIVFLLSITSVFAHEKELRTKADLLATSKYQVRKNHPWPFPLLSIGNNMQSYQNYGGSPYWHDGLDIRARIDQPIYAAAGGKVVNLENYQPGNDLYWEVAILDEDGFVWKYHHVDQDSIPDEVRNAFANGGSIKEGTLLGNVIRWPISSYGEIYHHLHLLVVAKDGQYINPFLMMSPLEDTKAPVIKKIGIAQNHKALDINAVRGPHALYLEASDLVLHEKFILPPHKITYRIDNGPEVTMWEFIHLPSGKNDTDYIDDFYMPGTCGNYSCRKFYFNLNFTKESPRKTMNLPAGNHNIEVSVEDVSGNKTSEHFEWKVL